MTLQDISNFFNKFISIDPLTATGNTLARWRVQLFSKTEPITSTSGALDVNITSGATGLGKAEDSAHLSGDVGVLSLGVRQAANAPLSGADGDYEPLQLDANGHLKVNIIDTLPAFTTIPAVKIDQTTPGTTDHISPISGQNGVAGNSGTVGANTQRFTLATDQPQLSIPLVVSPLIVTGTATFTRPNDTTAYAISDVICNSTSAPVIMEISLARANNIPFKVKNVRLFMNSAVVTNASFNLYLFNASVTPINDNAQWTLLTGDKAKYISRVGLTMFTEGTGSTSSMAESNDLNITVKSADSKLYLVLVAAAAYTPVALEVFDVYLDVEQQ